MESAAPLLLLLAALLTLRLLLLAARLVARQPSGGDKANGRSRRWRLFFVSIPILLSVTALALSDLNARSPRDEGVEGLVAQVERLKLEVTKLESMLDESTDALNSKNTHLDESNKLLEEMEGRIQFLKNSLSTQKTPVGSSSDSETIVTALEEEVRQLWAESRKNNFDYHILETKAHDEEKKVEEITSEVEKMESIITEQWIQIRQLEQSLQTMKSMMANIRGKSTSNGLKEKLSVLNKLKFLSVARHYYLPDEADTLDIFFLGNYISRSCISHVQRQLRRAWSTVKSWHYELQALVKQGLEMNKITALFAHQEIVFFLASTLVVAPVLSAWAFLQYPLQPAELWRDMRY